MSQEVGDELLTRVENGVLWLTINRADKGNAIPWYVRDALIAAFREGKACGIERRNADAACDQNVTRTLLLVHCEHPVRTIQPYFHSRLKRRNPFAGPVA